MDDDLQVDTPVLLEADLHPTPSSPVGYLGIAAPAPRNNVNIVVLFSSSNKPNMDMVDILLKPSVSSKQVILTGYN